MSPICLINVAGIRDHATPSHETRKTPWYARLTSWTAHALRRRGS
ncbi:hypothetical protein [Paraburkholderia sp. DHOC27]|nr:hypothetical protein [Paraburkholderia sp. DHOC27]